MIIKDIISRFSKILFGIFLISMTLTAETVQMGKAVLYSLFAIPFIVAGLFDWTPLLWVTEKVAGYLKPLAAYMKPRMKSV